MSAITRRLLSMVLVISGLALLSGCQDTAPGTSGTARAYPLDVCLVSGEKLGSMGEPVVFSHEGQEVKLCCKSCRPDFEKEPAKFIAKLTPKP